MLERTKPSFITLIAMMIVNIIAVIFSAQAFDIGSFDNIHIIFFLPVLFYWVVHDPRYIPLWFVFLGGLVIDFTLDGLLGLHAFGLILFYMVLLRYRRIILSQPMLYHWLFFMMTAAAFEILRWTMLSLLTWSLWPLMPLVIVIVMNAVTFFPIILVLKAVHRISSGNGRYSL